MHMLPFVFIKYVLHLLSQLSLFHCIHPITVMSHEQQLDFRVDNFAAARYGKKKKKKSYCDYSHGLTYLMFLLCYFIYCAALLVSLINQSTQQRQSDCWLD